MEAKPYVNGAMLSECFGKTICTVGRVTSTMPTGMGFTVQLCDGKQVKVQLEEQLSEQLEGYVQIIARVNRDCSLVAEHLVSFGAGEIDLDTFNKTVNLMAKFPEYFSSASNNEF